MSAVTLSSEAVLGRPRGSSTPRLQRGDGVAEIAFSAATGSTRLKHLYQKGPCRALFPKSVPGDLATGVIATTSGGITGGDRLRIDLAAGEGAAAVVTTQAAEKVYRSLGDDCIVDIHVRGETDTWLEWLPQETIFFDRGRMWRSTAIDGWSGAMIMAGDILVFGRLAHGEVIKSGFLHDSWKVSWNGRLIWRDALRLDGHVTLLLDDPAGFAGAVSVATFVYVADDAVRHLRIARDLLEGCQVRCGVTSVNGVLVARFLSSEPRVLRVAFGDFWAGFRQRVRGLPECLPRVWHG